MDESAAYNRTSDIAFLIYDAAGRLQAASAGAMEWLSLVGNSPVAQFRTRTHFAELFGSDSVLTQWLTEQVNQVRRSESHSAALLLDNNGYTLRVRLDALRQDDQLYGFAICISDKKLVALPEGDAVITRQQWHDIKNRLGGLKLYATFLKKKLANDEDRQIAEKMLDGLNGLIDHLARIRRGERL
jgi:nitrogen-specific signal transduction histidine kinase